MPTYCDLTCPFAAWPDDEALDGSGSCRTFIALHCRKYGELVAKNAPCLDGGRKRKGGPGSKGKDRRSRG